jgi:hypothetical protein
MAAKKQVQEIKLTPLRGKLKLKDVRKAVKQVITEREAREKAGRTVLK